MEPTASADDDGSPLAVARVDAPLRWAAPVVGLVALSGIALVAWSFSMPEGAFLACLPSGLAMATLASFVAPRFAFEPPRIPHRRCTVTRAGVLTRRGVPLLAADRVLGVETEVTPRGRTLRAFDCRLYAFEIHVAGDEDARAAARLLCGTRSRGVVAVRAQPWATPVEAVVAIAVVLGVLAATLALWGPVVVPLALLLTAIMMAATPTRVVVGDDAIHIGWLARRVTLPIGRITRAAAGATGATVDTRAVDRAAAAIALAATDDAARDVVHAVSRSTADPDLRRALEHAARGERVDASNLELLAAREPSARSRRV